MGPSNLYQAQQLMMMQPKPRHMMNPSAAFQPQQPPLPPSFAPPTSGVNPYTAMAAQHYHHHKNPTQDNHHNDPFSKSQQQPSSSSSSSHLGMKSPFADPVTSDIEHRATPSPPAHIHPPAQSNALLVEDPYSDAYRRPESPATRAQAAAIAASRFEVMKPEKTGQSLLDDLVGLADASSPSSTSNESHEGDQAPGFSSTLDLSDYGVIPSNDARNASPPPPSSSSVQPSSQANASSRFQPLVPTAGYSVETKWHTDQEPPSFFSHPAVAIPSLPSQPKPTSVGNLIDMELMLPQASAPPSSSSSSTSPAAQPQTTANSNSSPMAPTSPSSAAFLPPTMSGDSTPQDSSLLSIEAFLAQSMSPLVPATSESALAVAASSSSSTAATAAAASSASSSSSPVGVHLLIPDVFSPSSSHLENQVKSTGSFSTPLLPSPRPTPLFGSTFVSVERQPPMELQEKVRRVFREYASGSANVDCGTAGIIIEAALPSVESSKLDCSFSTQLRRLNVGNSVSEEMCVAIFVHVWNECQ